MKREDTLIITARCFHEEPASCSHSCPFFFDARTFLSRARDGKWGLAYKLYRNATVFPAIVSELCDAPCRVECQRGTGFNYELGITNYELKDMGEQASRLQVLEECGRDARAPAKVFFVGDEPVDIRAVEATAVRFAKNRKPESYRIPLREQRVAIIGAGLAGLSLALNLSQKAYPVTVFERGDRALPTWAAHPKYEYFLEEVRLQFSEVNTEFVYVREISGLDDPALAGFAYVHDATINAGIGAVPAIAAGIEASKAVETFLQTGKWPDGESGSNATSPARPEKHYVDHRGEPSKPIIVPADPAEGYTREEASLEASRCMGCDCRLCMDSCEMLGRYNKRPQKIAIEAYSDTKSAPPFSSCTLTRETYSCNLCGYCRSVCPVGADIEKLFHLARVGRAETGKHPKAFHDFWLRDFEWHRTEGSYFNYELGIRNYELGNASFGRYLFFPGCKLGARSPSQVLQAAGFLKDRYGAGVALDCCGAPAYWAGEDIIFQAHIESLREKWAAAGQPVFVFACAYCMKLFSGFLPEIEKVSLYELLAENGLCANKSEGSFAVFDPCVAREFPDMEKAVRELAVDGGLTLTELPGRNHCCGFGGHMRTANQELFDKIVEHRVSADETPYLVYCANCAETFDLTGKAHTHILDLMLSAGDVAQYREGLQKKRDNAIRTKAALMEFYENVSFESAPKLWDNLRLNFPDSVIADMNLRLIVADDVKEAIYEAERAGEVFVLQGGASDGGELRQCCLIREIVTTWVQYVKHGNGETAENYDYTIVDVWNHRMRFSDTAD